MLLFSFDWDICGECRKSNLLTLVTQFELAQGWSIYPLKSPTMQWAISPNPGKSLWPRDVTWHHLSSYVRAIVFSWPSGTRPLPEWMPSPIKRDAYVYIKIKSTRVDIFPFFIFWKLIAERILEMTEILWAGWINISLPVGRRYFYWNALCSTTFWITAFGTYLRDFPSQKTKNTAFFFVCFYQEKS